MAGSDLEAELAAMQAISQALDSLDEVTRPRVLAWVVAKFGDGGPIGGPNPRTSIPDQRNHTDGFETLADLFDAAQPDTDKDKALVAGYWQQFIVGEPSFGSQTINSNLKNLGHGVGNITLALTGLIAEKPALVLQIKKSGIAKQARKLYKLTEAGRAKVADMIGGNRGPK